MQKVNFFQKLWQKKLFPLQKFLLDPFKEDMEMFKPEDSSVDTGPRGAEMEAWLGAIWFNDAGPLTMAAWSIYERTFEMRFHSDKPKF